MCATMQNYLFVCICLPVDSRGRPLADFENQECIHYSTIILEVGTENKIHLLRYYVPTVVFSS